MKTAFTFDDVLIVPQLGKAKSRHRDAGDISLNTKIGHVELEVPIITANMRDITGSEMARMAYACGAFGILHRFGGLTQSVLDWKSIDPVYRSPYMAGVSIGVQESDKELFTSLANAGARVFCIDVAHGHHVLTKKMLKWIESEFTFTQSSRSEITIIAGNVATGDGFYDLVDWGADVVKVGIGPGSVCQTRRNTGVGVPQLYALQDVYQTRLSMEKRAAIIADGGIKYPGDAAKALKYADAVMVGGYVAGTIETPGKVFTDDRGHKYKVYEGSSSASVKGEDMFVEGTVKTIPVQGSVVDKIKELDHGIRSALSYVGASNLEEFRSKCEFIQVTSASSREGNY